MAGGRRGKVVIARIEERSRRNATLKKRKNCLVKKAEELSKLCGALVALVLYSPDEKEPTVYPQEAEARGAFSKFLDLPDWQSMAHSETAITFSQKKLRKKKQKAEFLKWNNQQILADYLLTLWADGEIALQDLDDEDKEIVSKFVKERKEELCCYMKKKMKDQEAAAAADSNHMAVPKQLAFTPVPLEVWVASGLNAPDLAASAHNYAAAANDPPLSEQIIIDYLDGGVDNFPGPGRHQQLNNFTFTGENQQITPHPVSMPGPLPPPPSIPSPSFNQLSPGLLEFVETNFGELFDIELTPPPPPPPVAQTQQQQQPEDVVPPQVLTGASPNFDMSATTAAYFPTV